MRFGRDDLVEAVLATAYMPLIRSGHTGTLAAFATKVRVAPTFPPAVVDLAEADIALADGAFELASRIAQRAVGRLGEGHELASRAETIIAESAYARARLADADAAYKRAYETAMSEDDRVAALRGWALSSLQGEMPVSPWVMEQLEERRERVTPRSGQTRNSRAHASTFHDRLCGLMVAHRRRQRPSCTKSTIPAREAHSRTSRRTRRRSVPTTTTQSACWNFATQTSRHSISTSPGHTPCGAMRTLPSGLTEVRPRRAHAPKT